MAADESVSWVVVDEDLELHVEARAYLAGLRGAGRAFTSTCRICPSRTGKPSPT
ncbi:hypothetical protein ACFQYP_18900 [Nonomuraea antimicrobica]|uniref:hypothetical protein n=1 Tax=Nonomuraea antimicrobica TaxID=561173 RepID=UPI0031E8D627